MNEKRREFGIEGPAGAGACGRSEELVAYLYGEARAPEEREFRAHLEECPACHEELAAFGGVRGSIALWRAEAESHAPALDLRGMLTAEEAPAAREAGGDFANLPRPRRRSARAALREFFSLSPLWLRAGAAAAALVVCALAALTLARGEVIWDDKGIAFRAVAPAREAPPAAPEREKSPAPGGAVHTREQVEAIVAERVEREVAAERQRLTDGGVSPSASDAADAGLSGPDAAPKRTAPRVVAAADRGGQTRRTQQGGNTRRAVVAGVEEESLPRLSDLLGGSDD